MQKPRNYHAIRSRIRKTVGHPFTVIVVFCLILIVGESTANTYIWYLMYGTTFLQPYGIIGVSGLILVFIAYLLPKGKPYWIFGLAGILSMITSLAIFFLTDPSGYNLPTFRYAISLVVLSLFVTSSACYLSALSRSRDK